MIDLLGRGYHVPCSPCGTISPWITGEEKRDIVLRYFERRGRVGKTRQCERNQAAGMELVVREEEYEGSMRVAKLGRVHRDR